MRNHIFTYSAIWIDSVLEAKVNTILGFLDATDQRSCSNQINFWSKVIKCGKNWPNMAKNGQKWPKMAKNGQKWPKIKIIHNNFV